MALSNKMNTEIDFRDIPQATNAAANANATTLIGAIAGKALTGTETPRTKEWRVDRWTVKKGTTREWVAVRGATPGCNLDQLLAEVNTDRKTVFEKAREKVEDFLFLVANSMELQSAPVTSISKLKYLLSECSLDRKIEATFFLFYYARDIVYPDVMDVKLEKAMASDILAEMGAHLVVPPGLEWNSRNKDCVTASFMDQYDRRRERIMKTVFQGDRTRMTIKHKDKKHRLPNGRTVAERPKWLYYCESKDGNENQMVREDKYQRCNL